MSFLACCCCCKANDVSPTSYVQIICIKCTQNNVLFFTHTAKLHKNQQFLQNLKYQMHQKAFQAHAGHYKHTIEIQTYIIIISNLMTQIAIKQTTNIEIF